MIQLYKARAKQQPDTQLLKSTRIKRNDRATTIQRNPVFFQYFTHERASARPRRGRFFIVLLIACALSVQKEANPPASAFSRPCLRMTSSICAVFRKKSMSLIAGYAKKKQVSDRDTFLSSKTYDVSHDIFQSLFRSIF